MKTRLFVLLAAFVTLTAQSCAIGSPYVYYVIDRPSNKLLNADPKLDLPLDKTCDADSVNKAKCIAMLTAEYFKMKQELLELRQALSDCQKGPGPK